jgi:hypothetical protein
MSRSLVFMLVAAAFAPTALADRAVEPTAGARAHFAEPPGGELGPVPYREPTRTLDRATVRARLAAARRANLAAFRAYQKRGVFPSNTYRDGKLNVWRDRDGHLCAAATIIDGSGQHDLVARVADQNNFIRLGSITQGPLMDWILTSGFTQDEIAAIQEPFMPVVDRPQLEPAPPQIVDRRLRVDETARLARRYAEVTRALVKDEQRSLDRAVERLMKRQELGWQLING